MNLKITNIQISSYAENEELPSLQYVADKLCEDDDMEYVLTKSKTQASLEKILVSEGTSIFAKLKDYDYEFEINSSLQLASIDGIKISTVPTNDNDTIASMTKAELKSLIASEVNLQLSNNSLISSNLNYSTEEQIIGTWIDGKSLYRRSYIYSSAQNVDVSDFCDTVDVFTSIGGIMKHSANNNMAPIPYYLSSTDYCYPYYNKSQKCITILYGNYNGPFTLTLEYTKK